MINADWFEWLCFLLSQNSDSEIIHLSHCLETYFHFESKHSRFPNMLWCFTYYVLNSMDFKKQCELVKKWTEENGDYKVDSLDERERKVNLRCNSNNLDFLFTITVPGYDLENWVRWQITLHRHFYGQILFYCYNIPLINFVEYVFWTVK